MRQGHADCLTTRTGTSRVLVKPTDRAPWATASGRWGHRFPETIRNVGAGRACWGRPRARGARYSVRPRGPAGDSLVGDPSSPALRGSFTLVELMVAIVIIAILISLLLPAINSAMTRARIAQVTGEMSQFNTALANFKANFGMYPPSRIVLHETAAGWGNGQAETVRSRAFIRRMWPQFNFNLDRDINGDGQLQAADQPLILNGRQCLVFFLGGISGTEDKNGNLQLDSGEDSNGNGRIDPLASRLGFAKNPANPFQRRGNRDGPYYEFDTTRLVINQSNGLYAYLDPLPSQSTPYAYFSAYEGRGYNEQVEPPLVNMKAVYHLGSTVTSPAFKEGSYQIISPGFDGQFGCGGPYDPDASPALPAWSGGGRSCTKQERNPERDNITNFADGTLAN